MKIFKWIGRCSLLAFILMNIYFFKEIVEIFVKIFGVEYGCILVFLYYLAITAVPAVAWLDKKEED